MEPKSEKKHARFVVLFHEFPPDHDRTRHWDLMLEEDGKLLTWALSEPLQPANTILATRLTDHRIEYLNYEGPVSGGRGSVSQVLTGTYQWQPASHHRSEILNFESHRWKIEFQTDRESQLQIEVSQVV